MNTLLLNNTAHGTLPAIVDPTDGITATTPTALAAKVFKNGVETIDSVTIVPVGGGMTGVYKWSYNPAGEIEGDQYSIVFSITIDSVDYYHTEKLTVKVAERGTNNASQHSANDVLTAIQGVTLSVGLVAGQRVVLDATQPDYPPATPGDLQPACEAALTTHGAATQAQLQPAGEAALATHGTATQAQLQPAVSAGLAAYDPPTKAELDAAVAGVNVWTNTQVTNLLASVAEIATETKRIPRAAAELTPGGQHRLTIGGQWVVQTISLESP